MGCPLDGGDNVKIEKTGMPSVKAGFVVCMHKNQLNIKVKGSKGKYDMNNFTILK